MALKSFQGNVVVSSQARSGRVPPAVSPVKLSVIVPASSVWRGSFVQSTWQTAQISISTSIRANFGRQRRMIAKSQLSAYIEVYIDVIAGSYPPDPPVLSGTGASGQANLSWPTPEVNGSALTVYILYQDGVAVDFIDPAANTKQVTGLNNGQPYDFYIVAHSDAGDSNPSNTVRVTPQSQAPSAPVLSGTRGDSVIHLSFPNPANTGPPISSYKVYRDGSLFSTIPVSPMYPTAGWLWTPVPASPVVDGNSAAMVAALNTPGYTQVVGAYEYGCPIFLPTAQTPRVTVKVLNEVNYSTRCDLSGSGAPGSAPTRLIPLDSDWIPSLGTDAKITVIDPVVGLVYDLQAVSRNPTTGVWSCDWGGVYPYASNGSNNGSAASRPTGSGLSQVAGTILIREMRDALAGVPIPHALIFSSVFNAVYTSFRAPATMSDGNGAGPVPEGARWQYIGSILGTWPLYAQIVAQAAKTFGMIDTDNAGGSTAFSVGRENFKTGDPGTDPWVTAGGSDWYLDLSMIPWDQSRVLRNESGT